MKKTTLGVFLSTAIYATSFTAGAVEAKNLMKTEILSCSLKVVHANESFSNALQQGIKIEMDSMEGEISLIDKTSGEEIVVAVENSEKNKGIYGVQLRNWPTQNSPTEKVSTGSILLMSQGTVVENIDEDTIIPPKGKKSEILLSLHASASLSNNLSALFITKSSLKALRDLGYKGSSIVTSYADFATIDAVVAKALAENKIQKNNIVAFGLESNCSVSSK